MSSKQHAVRLYDPQVQRMVSPDPMVDAPGDLDGWNPYAYVMNW